MKEELEKILIEKYSKIFQDINKPMTQTCMCWGIETSDGWFNLLDSLCSLIQWHIDQSVEAVTECEYHNAMVNKARAGDMTLFNQYFEGYTDEDKMELLKDIIKIDVEPLPDYGPGLRKVGKPIPQVIADQVKSKFAGLRFYFHGGDNYIEGAVGLAESLSETICEVCGDPGKVCGTGWITTLCSVHEANKL